MKNKYFLLLAIAFLGTSLFAQSTVWTYEGGDPGKWNVVENWRDGVYPDAATKTVFNVPTGGDCVVDVDSAVVKQLVMGDNDPFGGQLIIKSGGVLTTHDDTQWSTVGYNRGAELVIEAGGAIVSAHRFHVGLVNNPDAPSTGDCILEVAGTLTTGNKLTVNDPSLDAADWNCEVYVTAGGEINAPWLYLGTPSLFDVSGGTVKLQGDQKPLLTTYIDAGYLTAEGGDEAPTLTYVITGEGAEADTATWITSSTTVGIAPARTVRASIGVYPNPASDVVYFKDNTIADVEIYTINGQLVLRKNQVSQVNVEGLKPGYYIMKANSDNQLFTDKLIIK